MPVLQVTISGRDAGGFVFSNVFHLQADLGAVTFYQLLIDTCTDVVTHVLPQYQAAANDQCHFLDVAAKGVGVDASYSYHMNVDLPGTRAIDPALGAVAPLIRFFPDHGTIIGGLYAVGAGVIDFIADEIQAAYQTLLNNLAHQMLLWDGSVAPHHFQLVTYNSKGPVITPQKHMSVPTRPTTLNKRIRA